MNRVEKSHEILVAAGYRVNWRQEIPDFDNKNHSTITHWAGPRGCIIEQVVHGRRGSEDGVIHYSDSGIPFEWDAFEAWLKERPRPQWNMDIALHVVANDWQTLRKGDLFRLLEGNWDHAEALAIEALRHHPEYATEIVGCLADIAATRVKVAFANAASDAGLGDVKVDCE